MTLSSFAFFLFVPLLFSAHSSHAAFQSFDPEDTAQVPKLFSETGFYSDFAKKLLPLKLFTTTLILHFGAMMHINRAG